MSIKKSSICPVFSIIVPVYNTENELSRCIDSLRKQTFSDIEIILVDDGSTDSSGVICDKYAETDERIKVVHKQNGGLSDARNTGLKLASGNYLMFVDSDDYIVEDACKVFSTFIESNADIYIGLLREEDNKLYSHQSDAIVGKKYAGTEYYKSFHNSIIPCAVASVYRKTFLDQNRLSFILGKYHEDNEFTPKTYLAAESVVYTDNVFYIRCSRDNSITTHKDKRKNLEDILFICLENEKLINKQVDKKLKKILSREICTSYLSMFRTANIYQYHMENYSKYINKRFVLRNSVDLRGKVKAILFFVSPRLYVSISNCIKG